MTQRDEHIGGRTERTDSVLRRMVQGRMVSGSFFVKYWLQMFVCVALLLVYMTNRYSCQRQMEQIKRLQTRLEVVETEAVRVRGLYMGRIRESSMRERLDSAGLPLSVQNQPPFTIKLKP